jgi:hypothetical protein
MFSGTINNKLTSKYYNIRNLGGMEIREPYYYEDRNHRNV